MKGKLKLKDVLVGIRDFFPFHLFFAHLKYNIIGVLYWVFLFCIVLELVGESFGVAYLFYSPEYLGQTSWLSFLFLGFSVGGFTMAFHTYSYIRMGPHFPFVATLHRPFFKFCVNNSLLPLIFYVVLCYKIILFQRAEEFLDWTSLGLYMGAMFLGAFIFVLLSFLYFFPTNKDIFKLEKKRKQLNKEEAPKNSNIKSSLHRNLSWDKEFQEVDDKLYIYIGKNYRFKKSRGVKHYDYSVIQNVFSQNHINASIFEITIILSFFVLGLLRNQEIFVFPAASSILLLLTIILMLVSAFFSWFKLWTYPILIALFVGINIVSTHTEYLQFKNFAYGLDYSNPVPYNDSVLLEFQNNTRENKKDEQQFIETLNNWRAKQKDKPKLIVVNTSGGGLRSALWTFMVMQHLDSLSKGGFYNATQMVTGASGGMVGASYYRELYLRNFDTLINQSLISSVYSRNIAKDLLNGIGVSMATNDIFFRYQTLNYNGYSYPTDRGYALEQQLLNNTNNVLDKQLGDYLSDEQSSKIPTFIFSPTIIEDGKRLIICSQDLGFMLTNEAAGADSLLNENVEYKKLMKFNQKPGDLRFTTALRMNATFPYITPMVTLPTDPEIHIMDAGIRDNYGAKTTLRYLSSLEKWIKENTSGVILVEIRDTKKGLVQDENDKISLFEKLFKPLSNVYGNFPRVQDFNQGELVSLFLKYQDYPIDIVSFNLRESPKDKISLSWHLTKQEKQLIKNALTTPTNVREVERLLNLLQ